MATFKNYLTQKCMYQYNSEIRTGNCDSSDSTYQWTWDGDRLKSASSGKCLDANTSTLNGGDLSLTTCDVSKNDQEWSFSNNVITYKANPSYAVTDSPDDIQVETRPTGANYYQYWVTGSEVPPKVAAIITLKNYLTQKCMYQYNSEIRTGNCDSSDSTYQWAWFGDRLQSISSGKCLDANTSTLNGGDLSLTTCDVSKNDQEWSFSNNVITYKANPSYAVTDSPDDIQVETRPTGQNYQIWLVNDESYNGGGSNTGGDGGTTTASNKSHSIIMTCTNDEVWYSVFEGWMFWESKWEKSCKHHFDFSNFFDTYTSEDTITIIDQPKKGELVHTEGDTTYGGSSLIFYDEGKIGPDSAFYYPFDSYVFFLHPFIQAVELLREPMPFADSFKVEKTNSGEIAEINIEVTQSSILGIDTTYTLTGICMLALASTDFI